MEYYPKTRDADDTSLFKLVWEELMRILCRSRTIKKKVRVKRILLRH